MGETDEKSQSYKSKRWSKETKIIIKEKKMSKTKITQYKRIKV